MNAERVWNVNLCKVGENATCSYVRSTRSEMRWWGTQSGVTPFRYQSALYNRRISLVAFLPGLYVRDLRISMS